MKTGQKLILLFLRAKLNLMCAVSVKWGAKAAIRIFSTPYRKPRPFVPPVFEKCDEFTIRVNKHMIHGYRWNAQAERKVLIVHGFESRAYNFYRYVMPLVKQGLGVYAMDAKAHGKSEGKTIVVPEYVDMIKTLEQAYGQFHGFIAHSFGGIAVCLHQEKSIHQNARLVLIAPATETTTAIRLFCNFFRLNEKIRMGIHERIRTISGEDPSFFSIKRIAHQIKNPILWIHDKDDEITPLRDVQPLFDAALPNIEFMITEGLGHRKIYKENKVVRRTTEYLL